MQNNCFPNRDDFIKDFDHQNSSLIGKGTYGQVYKIKSKRPLETIGIQEMAVKFQECFKAKIFQAAQNEFNINRLMHRHENIIHIEKVYAWKETFPVEKYYLIMVMELASTNLSKEIEKRIQSKTKFSEEELFTIFDQCVKAFMHMKKFNIYHRDIKPENILIMQPNTFQIKVTDFGVSKTLQEHQIKYSLKNTLVGTPVFLSPILLEFLYSQKDTKFNKIKHNLEKSDIYSLGMTFLQTTLLINNELIGLNRTDNQDKLQSLLKTIDNQKFRHLISRMLVYDEAQRATYDELYEILYCPNDKLQNLKEKYQKEDGIIVQIVNHSHNLFNQIIGRPAQVPGDQVNMRSSNSNSFHDPYQKELYDQKIQKIKELEEKDKLKFKLFREQVEQGLKNKIQMTVKQHLDQLQNQYNNICEKQSKQAINGLTTSIKKNPSLLPVIEELIPKQVLTDQQQKFASDIEVAVNQALDEKTQNFINEIDRKCSTYIDIGSQNHSKRRIFENEIISTNSLNLQPGMVQYQNNNSIRHVEQKARRQNEQLVPVQNDNQKAITLIKQIKICEQTNQIFCITNQKKLVQYQNKEILELINLPQEIQLWTVIEQNIILVSSDHIYKYNLNDKKLITKVFPINSQFHCITELSNNTLFLCLQKNYYWVEFGNQIEMQSHPLNIQSNLQSVCYFSHWKTLIGITNNLELYQFYFQNQQLYSSNNLQIKNSNILKISNMEYITYGKNNQINLWEYNQTKLNDQRKVVLPENTVVKQGVHIKKDFDKGIVALLTQKTLFIVGVAELTIYNSINIEVDWIGVQQSKLMTKSDKEMIIYELK